MLGQSEDSGRTRLSLSETAFYPTSGGQPNDTGTIAGIDVVDVYESEDDIVHVLDAALDPVDEVVGKVNWARRHDHMQQHTGQHILSQALVRVCDIPTVGFAIGPDWSTIVLERKPDREFLRKTLELANAVIDEDRPVELLLPSEKGLEELPIRGTLPYKETIRIVRVGDFDWSPCGGTHCKSTADVRLILVSGIRKEKDTYRLEFVCGRRAERLALGNAVAVSSVASLLGVGPNEIVERTRALADKSRAQEKAINELREARVVSDFKRLAAMAKGSGKGFVAQFLADRTIQELRQLGHKLVEQPGILALLVCHDQDKVGIVFARSADREEDMNRVMQRVCGESGCRGGGNPSFATGGGGPGVDAEAVLDAARKALL